MEYMKFFTPTELAIHCNLIAKHGNTEWYAHKRDFCVSYYIFDGYEVQMFSKYRKARDYYNSLVPKWARCE